MECAQPQLHETFSPDMYQQEAEQWLHAVVSSAAASLRSSLLELLQAVLPPPVHPAVMELLQPSSKLSVIIKEGEQTSLQLYLFL